MFAGESLEAAILATVAYCDVFAFAPESREIHRFLLGKKASRAEVETALTDGRLVEQLSTRDGCWFLRGKDHLAPRRARFRHHSNRLWPQARRMASLVDRLGVAAAGMVTGSLAANNADEHADVDFLFIYPHERTWTSFLTMRMVAKIPVAGLSVLSPNYVLSERRLLVKPQNLFTAWEIAKAVPMFGFPTYERFIRANAWVDRYLPNALPLLGHDNGATPKPREDPPLVRAVTKSGWFARLEAYEKQRKYLADRRDVGVDMEDRAKKGSMDRHSPTRSFHTLSELRYRMDRLKLSAHPVYAEINAATNMLEGEMFDWAGESLPRKAVG